MNENEQLQLFEDQAIRTAWDEENEEWYFSVVDVVSVLTDAKDYDTARNYWKVTKKRLKDEGSQLVTDCNQLKMKSPKDRTAGRLTAKPRCGTPRRFHCRGSAKAD